MGGLGLRGGCQAGSKRRCRQNRENRWKTRTAHDSAPRRLLRTPFYRSRGGNGTDGETNLGRPRLALYKSPMDNHTPPADPPAWSKVKAPSLAEMEVISEEAYRRLPDNFRSLCEGLVIQVDDFPTEEVLDVMKAETEFDLLGLFQGVGLPFRSDNEPAPMPNMVWLYRRAILDYWAEHDEELGAVITHVLVHEIGHHFGLSDDDMYAIEDSVE